MILAKLVTDLLLHAILAYMVKSTLLTQKIVSNVLETVSSVRIKQHAPHAIEVSLSLTVIVAFVPFTVQSAIKQI